MPYLDVGSFVTLYILEMTNPAFHLAAVIVHDHKLAFRG